MLKETLEMVVEKMRKIVTISSSLPYRLWIVNSYIIKTDTSLSEYGLVAKVLHISGHSKWSIGILTANGDLFCGEMLENKDKPVLSSIMDDLSTANASVEKLKKFSVKIVC